MSDLRQTSRFEYDELSRLTKSTDPLNRVSQFGYDDLNRLVTSVDALAGESSQSFDADGNSRRLTDPNNNQTQFDFDLSGQLVQETGASGDKVKYTYNAKDLLAQVTNGRGQERQFEYDAIGRLTRWTDPDGSVSYTYDNNGNVLTVTDASGTITREYNKLNRVTKYTDTRGNTLKYAYNEVGNLVTLTYPDGSLVHYEYDAASQLVKVTDWANRVTLYDYDKNSRLISTLRPNGTQMTRVYDDAGQLKQQQDIVVATEEVISQFDFSYDAAGNIIKEESSPESDPDIDLEMTYMAANRLATYNHDVVQFDADGNMTRGPLAGELTNFGFDSRNRLVQAGDTVYHYDAENQRLGVNQIQYVVNSQPALSQVLVKIEADGTQTFYVYGLGLIGQESNGDYLSYHFDFRGSTVALTDETAQVIEQFQYSPYGVLLSGSASTTPFLFNGMYGVMSDESGLYYMRARFYSPEIRRFVNQDVLLGFVVEGQTLNRYAYVTGQPINFVDPFGLAKYCGRCAPGDYDCLLYGGNLCPTGFITVINDHHHVGDVAAFFRVDEIYMSDVKSMVDNVLVKAGNKPIRRLNILDHAVIKPNGEIGINVGKDEIILRTLPKYISELARLKGHFTSDGFVNLQHCQVGDNWKLLQKLSAIFGVPVYASENNYSVWGFAWGGDYVRVDPNGIVELNVENP